MVSALRLGKTDVSMYMSCYEGRACWRSQQHVRGCGQDDCSGPHQAVYSLLGRTAPAPQWRGQNPNSNGLVYRVSVSGTIFSRQVSDA